MKSMRQLINLMEGVMAVPSLGSSESNMQAAGTIGRGEAYANFDNSQQPARESADARFPNVSCSQCGQGFGPGNSGFSHCSDHAGMQPVDETAPPGEEGLVKDLKKEYPGHEDKAFATAWSIYNKKHGTTEGMSMEENAGNPEVEQAMAHFEQLVMHAYVEPEVAFEKISANLDPETAAAFRMALMQHGEDQQAQAQAEFPEQEVGMEEDLNNGYDNRHVARGSDYFPNGADAPVVNATGPSGARQGDNPEQKKMQVAETHKELVYAYRSFLKESAPVQKKRLTESKQIADVQVQDIHEKPEADSDSIGFDGAISMSATVINKTGVGVEIGYDVNVVASADVGWETDERDVAGPAGPESDTYETYAYATSGEPVVSAVTFLDGGIFIYDNQEVTFQELRQFVDTAVLNQLLTPEIYAKALSSSFDEAANSLEPEEQEYDGGYDDYDDRNDIGPY